MLLQSSRKKNIFLRLGMGYRIILEEKFMVHCFLFMMDTYLTSSP